MNSADLHIAQSNDNFAHRHKCVCQDETSQLHLDIMALLYSGIQQVYLLAINVLYFNLILLLSLR